MLSEEARLTSYVETLMGGRVLSLERQPRWRKAWFAEVECDGKVVPLYIRGDKQLDAEPFPGLEREASILRALEAGGIMVPHIFGFCPDPDCIVMQRTPGARDVSQAANDQERQQIAEQYVEQLARMHSLDPALFSAGGLKVPADSRSNALAYIDANQPLYDRGKRRPQPFIEFALRWARQCAPMNRKRASFIQCDTGQFLFADGQLTGLYDFEASHIGDPLADLAALRTRDGFEPLGADVSHLLRYYAKLTGEAIDPWVLSFYTATFSLTSVMALSGPLSQPEAQPLEMEYLIWDFMTRRATIWAMAECMELRIPTGGVPPAQVPRQALVYTVLEQTVSRLPAETDMDRHHRASAVALARWAGELAAAGQHAAERERASLARLLDSVPGNWAEADLALEQFVMQAGPEHDEALLQHFALQLEDQIALAGSLRERLAGYALKPVVL